MIRTVLLNVLSVRTSKNVLKQGATGYRENSQVAPGRTRNGFEIIHILMDKAQEIIDKDSRILLSLGNGDGIQMDQGYVLDILSFKCLCQLEKQNQPAVWLEHS